MRVNVLYDNRIAEAPIDADDGLEVYKSGLRKRAWRWQGTTAGMDVGVTADTTNGQLTITVTGVSATSINWICELEFIKVGASL